jgi:hypothetical protein
MFWIYGGAWMIGGNGEFGLYTGEHLAMKHGVVRRRPRSVLANFTRLTGVSGTT